MIDYAALRAELRLPAEVQRGQPVPLVLVVRNTSDRPVWLQFGDSTYAFDFTVGRPDGEEVWSRRFRLRGDAIPAILRLIPIPAGDSVRFTDTWDQRGNGGARVSPGMYTVRGTFDTQEDLDRPDDMKTQPGSLTIAP
ncbi:MAG TPA: BsuPI-related putative proteinase inhibitor [Longimicrobiaceae bacterium]|nr:BsuPI-related putative proteinase inhibitor [Longimicrobiaceae bacterium]